MIVITAKREIFDFVKANWPKVEVKLGHVPEDGDFSIRCLPEEAELYIEMQKLIFQYLDKIDGPGTKVVLRYES